MTLKSSFTCFSRVTILKYSCIVRDGPSAERADGRLGTNLGREELEN